MDTLELRQGKDLKILIFLFEEIRDTFGGRRIAVNPKQRSGIPHIHMGHMVDGNILPQNKIICKEYTMKLEFGTAKDGKIPGRIHLRLPDEARSFVVGTFEAEIK